MAASMVLVCLALNESRTTNMKSLMIIAILASSGMAAMAQAETATSGKEHGIWHRFAAYDIGNVRPQAVSTTSPTTAGK